uniref:Uncharacterized protein n=1 Tax=Anguilla anguilla TaxID=7936 RepID=A0A0E9X4U0_ANGAN
MYISFAILYHVVNVICLSLTKKNKKTKWCLLVFWLLTDLNYTQHNTVNLLYKYIQIYRFHRPLLLFPPNALVHSPSYFALEIFITVVKISGSSSC